MYNNPSGLVWHSRWSGDSDGLSRTNARPCSATRVWWDREHVLELSWFPSGGQHREWHRLRRQCSASRYKYLPLCSWDSLLPSVGCRELMYLLFFVPPSAQSQAFVDGHLLIRRYQFNEQLWWPLSCHHSLRAERYKKNMFYCHESCCSHDPWHFGFLCSLSPQMLRHSGARRETSWLWRAWRDMGFLQSQPVPPLWGTPWLSSIMSKENTSTLWKHRHRFVLYRLRDKVEINATTYDKTNTLINMITRWLLVCIQALNYQLIAPVDVHSAGLQSNKKSVRIF